MHPIRFVFTPLRQLALRRLCYHLAGSFAAVLAATLAVHEGESLRHVLLLTWGAFRLPAMLYVLGYAQQSAKSAEDSSSPTAAPPDVR